MDDRQLRTLTRTALSPVLDRAPDAVPFDELVPSAEPHQSSRLTTPFAIAAGAALVTVVAVVIAVLVSGPEQDAITPPSSTNPTSTTMGPAPSALAIDAPSGPFVVSHLRATVSGTSEPGELITVAPTADSVAGSEQALSTTADETGHFALDLWLELGDNQLTVESEAGDDERSTANLTVTVLPALRNLEGFIAFGGDGLAFTPATFTTEEGDSKQPPTLTLLSARPSDPSVVVDVSGEASEDFPLDARVRYLALSDGGTWQSVSRSAFVSGWSPETPYWVSVHDGVVVQIVQARPTTASEPHLNLQYGGRRGDSFPFIDVTWAGLPPDVDYVTVAMSGSDGAGRPREVMAGRAEFEIPKPSYTRYVRFTAHRADGSPSVSEEILVDGSTCSAGRQNPNAMQNESLPGPVDEARRTMFEEAVHCRFGWLADRAVGQGPFFGEGPLDLTSRLVELDRRFGIMQRVRTVLLFDGDEIEQDGRTVFVFEGADGFSIVLDINGNWVEAHLDGD